MSPTVYKISYSYYSFAVFGDTYEIKEELKRLGGKFNPRLKHEDGIRAGWIVSKKQSNDLDKLLKKFGNGEGEVGGQERKKEAKEAPKSVFMGEYTPKSIAVFGETRPWWEKPRDTGGRFNHSLTLLAQKCSPKEPEEGKEENETKKEEKEKGDQKEETESSAGPGLVQDTLQPHHQQTQQPQHHHFPKQARGERGGEGGKEVFFGGVREGVEKEVEVGEGGEGGEAKELEEEGGEKSVAVFGESREVKEKLKGLGGKTIVVEYSNTKFEIPPESDLSIEGLSDVLLSLKGRKFNLFEKTPQGTFKLVKPNEKDGVFPVKSCEVRIEALDVKEVQRQGGPNLLFLFILFLLVFLLVFLLAPEKAP